MNNDFLLLLPEFLVTGLAFGILIADFFLKADRKHLLGYLTAAGLLLILAITLATEWDTRDTLYGGLSSDNGDVGTSFDVMYGGSGDDLFYGGEGVDWIYTGEGADRIYIETGNGFDVIADFDVAAGDRLLIAANVNGLTLTGPADLIALASDNPDGDVELNLGSHYVRLIGIRASDLTSDYFELF